MLATDLTKLGKQLANSYVTTGASLNDGLVKLGHTRGLNKQQLQRVAEAANQETYLCLMKTAEDKYLEFPLADASVAHIEINKAPTKVASIHDDYATSYSPHAEEPVFGLYTKLYPEDAFVTPPSADNKASIYKKASLVESMLSNFDTHKFEASSNFEANLSKLAHLTRQGVLQDICFTNTCNTIKIASPLISEVIIPLIEEDIKEKAPHKDLTKKAETTPTAVDPSSELFKLAQELQNNIVTVIAIDKHINENLDRFKKIAEDLKIPVLYKKADIASPITTKVVTHVEKNAKAMTAIAIGAIPAAYYIGKRRGKRQQGELLSKQTVEFLRTNK